MESSKRSRKLSDANLTLKEGPIFLESEVKIIDLPTEMLETILENISFHEISKVREVCRSFREVGNGMLNRGFLKLENLLAKTNDGLKTTLLQPRQEGHVPSERVCLRMLDLIGAQVRFVRAVCYRYIFLSDISCSFFAGKIIDVIHGFLRLVRLKTIEEEDAQEVGELLKLVDKFTDFYQNRIEPTLVASEATGNRATLFGSKVIDLLDCFLDCDKNVDISLDSEGWFHLKGEYKIYVSSYYVDYPENAQSQQLSANGQRSLHEWLRYLITMRSQCYVLEEERNFNAAPKISFIVCSGSYEELCHCSFETSFDGTFSSRYYRRRSIADNKRNDISNCRDGALTFEFDMRCRKELAPLEKLLEWNKNSSDEEHSEAEGSPENTDHDLKMRLEIWFRSLGYRPEVILYRCLIKQKYFQEEPLPNPAQTEEVLIRPTVEVLKHVVLLCGGRYISRSYIS